MRRSLWRWICWFVFLLILDFTVPFLMLGNVPTMMGSFLFWVVWIVIAIASMFMIFLRWREYEDTK